MMLTPSTGAMMFMFEGSFGVVLHIGDCRLTLDCLSALMPLLAHRIDYLFLDCTFVRCPLQFPTKGDSIRQVSYCFATSICIRQIAARLELLGSEFPTQLL